MITPATEKLVVTECRRLCETLGLYQVYLAENMGKRRHYLAGYGQPRLGRPEQIQLTYTIAVLWHGTLLPEKEECFVRSLCALTERLEKELALDKEQRNSIQQPVKQKEY
jgi:hypothetical protein